MTKRRLQRRVLQSCGLSLILIAQVTIGRAAPLAQSAAVDTVSAASKLSSRDWSERRDAISRLLRVRGDELSPVVIDAVLGELDRLNRTRGVGQEELPAGADPEAGFDYRVDLLTIASKSKDPRVIPYLADALGSGNAMSDALARWGNEGAAAVLAAARSRSADPWFVTMALKSLKVNVDRNPSLTQQARSQIASFARPRLRGQQISHVVVLTLDLLGSLRDTSALGSIEAISKARSAAVVGLVLVDARISKVDPFERVRLKAAEVLARVKRRSS